MTKKRGLCIILDCVTVNIFMPCFLLPDFGRPNVQKEVNIMEKLKGKYETVFIVNTELGEEKVQELVANFKGRIEKNATVENVDEWGKRRLAYPIDDVNDGYYVVMQYTADRDFPVELERRFSITEGILRSMTIRLDA